MMDNMMGLELTLNSVNNEFKKIKLDQIKHELKDL